MRLSKLINIFENEHTLSILWDKVSPYKKILYAYYKKLFMCEPVWLVTSLTNSTCYGRIVPETELYESITSYLEVPYIDSEDEEIESYYEIICANSKLLKELL